MLICTLNLRKISAINARTRGIASGILTVGKPNTKPPQVASLISYLAIMVDVSRSRLAAAMFCVAHLNALIELSFEERNSSFGSHRSYGRIREDVKR